MYASWRTVVSQRGNHGKDYPLLCSAEEAPDRERLRMPVPACGVSLAFLLRLHDSFLELGLEGRARTTTVIVAKLLSPAGILQPTQRPSTPQQAQHTLQCARLDSRGRKSGEDGPRGSVDLLRTNLNTRLQCTTPPMGQKRGPNFASAPGLQSAKEVRTRLWDLVDPYWCGKPSYYVCYAWKGDFLEMLATVVDRISRQQDHKEETSEGESKVDLNAIHVWLDVLALPQQYLGNTTTLDGPIFGPPPGLFDVQSARDVVCSCDRGLVIMLDRDMAVLSRTWPLFEVWLAAYYCPQDVSTTRVYAAIPKGIHVSMLLHLQTSCLSGLEVGRTTSSRPEDKQHIMVEVRHASGQKRMQVLTSESILRATRGWLRWSGEPQDMALYASLMLQSKEYAQLQYVLNAVEEIHDDEATIKEVRDLFAIYDEDGTGTLEEDEFSQVLSLAGFGPEESRSIFKQVDVDGGGSVELDEFETWWIESQRQQNRSCRPKPDLTVNGLVTNLKGLAAMLQRRDDQSGADSVMKLVEDLVATAAGPRSPFPDGMLPATEVYGDWRGAASNLGFKIGFNDLRPALRMLHGLLMANVDTLALDASPAAVLPSPNSLGSDTKLQKATLAWYIALMAELLSRNPCTLREADFFMREATDLSAPEKHEAVAQSSRGMIANAIAKARKESAKDIRNDAQIEAIVAEMVRLKHGKNAIISNKLVAEANVSLSTYMAASKGRMCSHPSRNRKGQKGTSRSANSAQVQSVIDFTANYLNSGSSPAVHSGAPSESNHGSSSAQDGGGGGSESSGQRVRGSAPTQDPTFHNGKSHAQLAYLLGEARKALIEEAKGGGSLGEVEEEEEEEGQTPGTDEADESSSDEAEPAPSKPHDRAELLDRFHMQQGTEEAGVHDRPESTPSGRRSLSYSRGKRSLSITSHRLSVDQGNEGREQRGQSPGKGSPRQQQHSAGPSPKPPPYPPSQGTESKSRPEEWHITQLLEQAREARDHAAKAPTVDHMKNMFARSSTVPLNTPRELNNSPGVPGDAFHPTSSYPPPRVLNRAGSQMGVPGPSHHNSNSRRTLPMPPIPHPSGPSHEGHLPEKHGGTSPAAPQQSLPASLPSAFAPFVGNSFAKQVAAAREQPRMTTPMVQPMVNASDLEALRARIHSQANHRGGADSGLQATAMPWRASNLHSISRDPGAAPSLLKRDSYPQTQNGQSSGSAGGDGPGVQPGKGLSRQSLENAGRGSRLKNASSSSTAPGDTKGDHRNGLSLMSHRSPAAEPKTSVSASKWFSKLSGTGLPGLSKPKPLAPSLQPAHDPSQ